jgi:hypothetical protein
LHQSFSIPLIISSANAASSANLQNIIERLSLVKITFIT